VERENSTFQNLEFETRNFVERNLVRNIHASFEQAVPEILEDVRDGAAIFFIDPFGTSGVDASLLKKIIEKRETQNSDHITEVLVRFDDSTVKRLIKCIHNNLENIDPAQQKRAHTMLKRVEALSDQAAWQAVLEDDFDVRNAILEGYEKLVKNQAHFQYSLSYPIRNPVTRAHKYFLTFFGNFVDGYIHVANFMAKAERNYQMLQNSMASMFASEPEWFGEYHQPAAQTKNIETIASRLEDVIREQKWSRTTVERRYVYAKIVDTFRWRYVQVEWQKALLLLKDKRIITAIDGTTDGAKIAFG